MAKPKIMISDIFLCGDLVVEIQFLSKNIQIVYRLKSIDHKNIKGLILRLRENTRSFGKSTTGLTTGNAQFKLSDG